MSNCFIRIATQESDLAMGYLLYAWQLPMPNLPVYNDHASKVPVATGGVALRGAPSVSLTWNRLTTHQAHLVYKLVNDSLDSGDGLMYATVNRAWSGRGVGEDWVDIKGYPHPPDTPIVPNTQGRLFQQVTLVIANFTIVNDPASF